MPLSTLGLLVNTVLLLIFFITANVLFYAGNRFYRNPGFPEIQGPMQRIILRGIALLALLTFFAIIFNLYFQ